MKLCDECHRRQARVYLTTLADGAVTPTYLCGPCALARGVDPGPLLPGEREATSPGVAARLAASVPALPALEAALRAAEETGTRDPFHAPWIQLRELRRYVALARPEEVPAPIRAFLERVDTPPAT